MTSQVRGIHSGQCRPALPGPGHTALLPPPPRLRMPPAGDPHRADFRSVCTGDTPSPCALARLAAGTWACTPPATWETGCSPEDGQPSPGRTAHRTRGRGAAQGREGPCWQWSLSLKTPPGPRVWGTDARRGHARPSPVVRELAAGGGSRCHSPRSKPDCTVPETLTCVHVIACHCRR